MLSKFDLKPGKKIDEFEKNYFRFVEVVRKLDLIETAGAIGRRVKNTPMDTAGDEEPEFYSIMGFRDRTQLDAAYEYLLNPNAMQEDQFVHSVVSNAVANPIFICWQDIG